MASVSGTDVTPEEHLPEVAHAVAIIMDGSGRWAVEHGVSVADGHRAGSRALRPVVETAIDLGIESLVVYAFSTENWTRPADEVAALMEIFGETIERAIQESDLGLTPSNDGKLIRLPIPQLTEERRKELVKVVRHMAEEGKVAVRNVRRDVMHHLKELVDKGEVGSDEERRAEERVQKLTDENTHTIDELLKKKEAEILEV